MNKLPNAPHNPAMSSCEAAPEYIYFTELYGKASNYILNLTIMFSTS